MTEMPALGRLNATMYIRLLLIFLLPFVRVYEPMTKKATILLTDLNCMKKSNRYRMAGANPYSIYEVFTMNDIINRVAFQYRPWQVHRLEKISVIHFLN